MDTITRRAVTAHTLTVAYMVGLVDRFRRADDRGQASTEYAGILFVIVAIIAALIAVGFTEVGQAIKQKIIDAVGKIGV
jgi:Flp pilus assembly pilin Flp